MPAPVTHLVLAISVLSLIPEKDKIAFLRGVSFPDIRYPANIDRSKTHPANVSWQDVKQAKTSFEAGVLFHALTDQVHQQYIKKHKAHDYIPTPGYHPYFLKFYEDILLYDKIADWPEILSSLNEVMPEELTFGIPKETVERWYETLRAYCSTKPNTAKALALLVSLETQIIPETLIDVVIEKMQKSKELNKIVNDFYKKFPDLIVNY